MKSVLALSVHHCLAAFARQVFGDAVGGDTVIVSTVSELRSHIATAILGTTIISRNGIYESSANIGFDVDLAEAVSPEAFITVDSLLE
jgi:hypothetical protein